MNIRIVQRRELDEARYHQCIADSKMPLPYAFAPHLDMVAPHWKVLVYEDYEMVFPFAYNRKWLGIPRVVQPQFCQQLGLFGRYQSDPVFVKASLEKLGELYFRVMVQLNATNPEPKCEGWTFRWRDNYELDLSPEYEAIFHRFRRGHKHVIRQARKVHRLERGEMTGAAFVAGWSRYAVDESPALLEQLIGYYGTEHVYTAYLSNGHLGAAAFFVPLSHFLPGKAERLVYLAGWTTPEGRESRAMHFLLDRVIAMYAGSGAILDFEGSELPGPAMFFRGFRPERRPYLLARR